MARHYPSSPKCLETIVREKLTGPLASAANWPIIVVQDNADLLHQADLLLVIARKFSPFTDTVAVGGGENIAGQRSIDVGKESGHIVCRDLRRSSHSCSSAHLRV